MKNTKLTVITVLLAMMLTVSYSDAREKDASSDVKKKSKRSDKSARASKSSAEYQVRRYAAIYGLSQESQDKLTKIFEAQQKDLADHQKLYGPKNQAIDEQTDKLREQIAKLHEQIAELEKSKGDSVKALKELKLDHQAELDGVITTRYKIARVARSLKGEDRSGYWKYLPKETQEAFDQQCQAAAVELVASEKADSRRDFSAARVKLNEAMAKVITPEMRKTAETQQLKDYVLRGLTRYGLTEDQKTQIGALCDKSVADKAAAQARYNQFIKDYAALRRSMSKYKGSLHYHEIRTEAVKSIMTEEQRKKLSAKYRASSKKVKKDKSSSKRDSGKATL
ncbi:MAG: hypothetical protein QGG25_00755 [Phycisphaerae bacterium]|jgi:hypothetical protein|nr:hypothetical protein [Phycisphaerae bacterium]